MYDRSGKYLLAILSAVCSMVTGLTAQAGDIEPIDCMIEPNIMVEISSPVDGVLDTLLVDRSDEVKKGEVIATLKSDVEQVAVKMSKERLKLSQTQYDRARGLYKKKAISRTEIDRLDNEKKLAELDLQHAEANLDLRQIRSPIDGVVVKRYSSPGEFVEAAPVIKLAQLDPLKIEVVSPVSNYGKITRGMKARILPDFGSYQELIAEVIVVDKVIDAASGTFGVRLELPNHDFSIPSGLKCKVDFMPDTKQSAIIRKNPAAIASVGDSAPDQAASALEDGDLMCSTVGPFKEQKELDELLNELATDVKQTALHTDTKVKTTYLVVSKSFSTLEETNKKMQSMKAAGFTDIAVMNKNGQYQLALGLYRKQSYARERVASLQDKGYDVHMSPMNKEVNSYWADVIYSSQSADAVNSVLPETRRSACDESVRLSMLK